MEEDPNFFKNGAQCSEEEKKKFMDLFDEFCDVFAWYYVDLRGFDPSIIQHVIPIKEYSKHVRQRQRPVNPALEALFVRK
jgi:hypothetical protein